MRSRQDCKPSCRAGRSARNQSLKVSRRGGAGVAGSAAARPARSRVRRSNVLGSFTRAMIFRDSRWGFPDGWSVPQAALGGQWKIDLFLVALFESEELGLRRQELRMNRMLRRRKSVACSCPLIVC